MRGWRWTNISKHVLSTSLCSKGFISAVSSVFPVPANLGQWRCCWTLQLNGATQWKQSLGQVWTLLCFSLARWAHCHFPPAWYGKMPIAVGSLALRVQESLSQECQGYHQAHKDNSPGIPLSKPSGVHGVGAGEASVGEVHTLEFFLCLTLIKYTSSEFSPFLPPSGLPFPFFCPLSLSFALAKVVSFPEWTSFPHLGDTKEQGIFWYHDSHEEPLVLWNAGPLLQMCFLLKLLLWFLFLGETSMCVC